MKKPFTVFRCTNHFMHSLNSNSQNRALHRQRSDMTVEQPNEDYIKAIIAINHLLSTNQLIPVAVANCDASELFRETNTISHFWGENNSITLLPESDIAFMSSTSVGDIFQDADGIYYLTTPFTFLPLQKVEFGLVLPVCI